MGLSVLLVGFAAPYASLIFFGYCLLMIGGAMWLGVIFINLEARFDFVGLMGAVTLFACGTGVAWNYCYTALWVGLPWDSSLTLLLNVNIKYLSLAGVFIALYCLFLHLLSIKLFLPSRKQYGECLGIIRKIQRFSRQSAFTKIGLIVGVFFAIVQLSLIWFGLYTFRGRVADEGVESPLVVVVTTAVPAVFVLLGMLIRPAIHLRLLSVVSLSVLSALAAFELIWSLLAGRTALAVFLVSLGVGYRLCNPVKRIRPSYVIVIVACLLLLQQATNLYQYSRGGDYVAMEQARNAPLKFLLENALRFSGMQDSERAEIGQAHNENLATRGLILGYFAQYLEYYYENWPPAAKGENLFNNFAYSAPRILFPNKVRYKFGEVFYLENQGFFAGDDGADSFYMDSFVDFNLVGFVLYPLVLSLVLIVTLRLAVAYGDGLTSILVFGGLFAHFVASSAEGGLLGYLVLFRNLGILIILSIVIERLFLLRQTEP